MRQARGRETRKAHTRSGQHVLLQRLLYKGARTLLFLQCSYPRVMPVDTARGTMMEAPKKPPPRLPTATAATTDGAKRGDAQARREEKPSLPTREPAPSGPPPQPPGREPAPTGPPPRVPGAITFVTSRKTTEVGPCSTLSIARYRGCR